MFFFFCNVPCTGAPDGEQHHEKEEKHEDNGSADDADDGEEKGDDAPDLPPREDWTGDEKEEEIKPMKKEESE